MAKSRVSVVLAAIIVVHVLLLAYGGCVHSPVYDEWWHLPSGVNAWREGRRDLFRINPPLIRMVAVLPVLPLVPSDRWFVPPADGPMRSELAAGHHFSARYAAQMAWWTTLARWACILFSVLGVLVCYRWASELYGANSGLIAAALWCFCPNILAHAQMMTPDAGAAAVGLAASYAYWKWLRQPTWAGVIVAGVVLGLALLTKLTLVILIAVWPAIWLMWMVRDLVGRRRSFREGEAPAEPKHRENNSSAGASPSQHIGSWMNLLQLVTILALGVTVLNAGYEFDGSLRRLDRYEFVSETFRGPQPTNNPENAGQPRPRNRFRGTILGYMPIPLPADYLLGIDRVKLDFENGWWSYLRGEWSQRGWWYYYLYAAAIKVPLGTWLLGMLAVGLTFWKQAYRSWDEIALVLPGIALFAFVSAETGFSHHLRYVLPAFPFAFIWCSKVARAIDLGDRRVAIVGGVALAWSILSSLAVYPHSLSYFNELVGGPKGGHWHLDKSNTDWGQDVFFLKKWHDANPESRPLHVLFDGVVNSDIAGLKFEPPPIDKRSEVRGRAISESEAGPLPGWYAISVNHLISRTHDYDYFQEFEPVDWIGYSMVVYHLTVEDCNRVRGKLGLPEVAAPDQY